MPPPEKRQIHCLEDLEQIGEWCPKLKLWRRTVPLSTGASVELLEDLSETDTHGTHCLWPGSLVLSKFLENCLAEELGLRNMRVLELGAGLGLCAMTAAALGAEVIATERPGEALDFLRANLHMNDATTSSRVSVEALDWAHRGAAQKLLAKYGQPHLVLGSDLCYNRDTIVMLQETMSEVAVGGTQVHIFMAQDQESVPGGTSISRQFFEECLPVAGFSVQRQNDAAKFLGPQWSDPQIRLYRISLDESAVEKMSSDCAESTSIGKLDLCESCR